MPRAAADLLADSNIAAGILRARGSQIVAAMNGDTAERRPRSTSTRC